MANNNIVELEQVAKKLRYRHMNTGCLALQLGGKISC